MVDPGPLQKRIDTIPIEEISQCDLGSSPALSSGKKTTMSLRRTWPPLGALIGLIFLAGCTRTNAPAPSEPAALSAIIYGDDSRDEGVTAPPLMQRNRAATAALVHRRMLNGLEAEVRPLAFSHGVCPDVRFAEQPTLSHCSALLVAPDVVLTARHCVADEGKCARSAFVFGWNSSVPARLHSGLWRLSFQNSQVYNCKNILHASAASEGADDLDYALVRLDRTVNGVMPLKLPIHQTVPGEKIHVFGHPNGLPQKHSVGNVRSRSDWHLLVETDTFTGDSGAGVFSARTGGLIGLLQGGERDYELDGRRGCWSPRVCASGECDGERVLELSQVHSKLIEFLLKER